MNGVDYKNWLDNLQVGDKVAVEHIYGGTTLYRIAHVERITPTKQIKVSGDETKLKDGAQVGNNNSWMHSYYLKPITKEVLEAIEREKLLARISKYNWRELGTEQLREIKKIVED